MNFFLPFFSHPPLTYSTPIPSRLHSLLPFSPKLTARLSLHPCTSASPVTPLHLTTILSSLPPLARRLSALSISHDLVHSSKNINRRSFNQNRDKDLRYISTTESNYCESGFNMGDIRHLPEAVHSSVRSGIILFDLARVVEELIFNSIDAGATKISVALGVGTCYIKVVDNGVGITRDGLVLLGERYDCILGQTWRKVALPFECWAPYPEGYYGSATIVAVRRHGTSAEALSHLRTLCTTESLEMVPEAAEPHSCATSETVAARPYLLC